MIEMNIKDILLGFVLLVFVVMFLFLGWQDYNRVEKENNYCKDKGWEGAVWGLDTNTCYKNINDSSGLGTRTIYSGKVDLNKELKEK